MAWVNQYLEDGECEGNGSFLKLMRPKIDPKIVPFT
jgi:hypothetical protein